MSMLTYGCHWAAMGKNSRQPLFRFTASTVSNVEMHFLVNRECKMWWLNHMVWEWMYDWAPEETVRH